LARKEKTPFTPAPMVLLKGKSPLEVSVYLSEVAMSIYKRSQMAASDAQLLHHAGVEILKNTEVISQILNEHVGGENWKVADVELTRLMLNAFTIGTLSVCTPEAKNHHEKIRAFHARMARSQSDDEKGLMDAIVALRGNGPSPQPSKEAECIIFDVNRLLAEQGRPAVLVDVIYRRLKKFPRS
jgi:hypothetical protein